MGTDLVFFQVLVAVHPASPDPEAESAKQEDRDRLHLLLKDLDETDRAAVVMR